MQMASTFRKVIGFLLFVVISFQLQAGSCQIVSSCILIELDVVTCANNDLELLHLNLLLTDYIL